MSNGLKGGQEGNHNASKNKPWRDAINRALARYGEGKTDGGLNKLADQLLLKCKDGDIISYKHAKELSLSLNE